MTQHLRRDAGRACRAAQRHSTTFVDADRRLRLRGCDRDSRTARA